MEEKILLPAVQRLRGGEPLPVAVKLRLDHGALAALLMPTPTTAILAKIRGILADHNALEEGRDGLYEICDRLRGGEAERLLTALRAAPEVNVMAHPDSPAVVNAVRRALERAGYAMGGFQAEQPGSRGFHMSHKYERRVNRWLNTRSHWNGRERATALRMTPTIETMYG